MNRPHCATLAPRAALLLAVLLVVALPSVANAVTDEDDWAVSSTLDSQADPDNDEGIILNVEDCRRQLGNGGDEIVTFNLEQNSFDDDAEQTVKVAIGNEACNELDLDSSVDEDCITIFEREVADPTVDVTLDTADFSPVGTADECENLDSTTTVYLIVDDPNLLDTNDETNVYTVAYDIRFRTTRPASVTGVVAEAGENSIKVDWTAVSGDVEEYRIYATTGAIAAGTRPETLDGLTRVATDSATSATVSGATVDTTYNVTVVAIDQYGNESLVGEVVSVTTQPVDDFWERYSAQNPDVDGGHCFIATAAWGSYQAPHVKVLRRFRDEILMPWALGRAFVDAYYATSPPLADFIAAHDSLRAATRVLLLPLYGFAVLMLYTGLFGKLALLLATVLSLGLLRRVWRRRRSHRVAAPAAPAVRTSRRRGTLALSAAAAMLVAVFSVGTAHAESPVDMMFELKAGPYTPDGLQPTFTEIFGDDDRVLFELELDYQLYRGWGSLALAGGLGYTNATGSAQTSGGEDAIDETTLNWMPLRVSAVYRWDWFWLRFNVPLTIYGKIGLDYWVWWTTGGDDEVSVNAAGDEGAGGTYGWHGVGGVAFVLDWLAPAMAANFDVEWGVNNSYLFAEYIYNAIDDFGAAGAFDLSNDGTFAIGLALEF